MKIGKRYECDGLTVEITDEPNPGSTFAGKVLAVSDERLAKDQARREPWFNADGKQFPPREPGLPIYEPGHRVFIDSWIAHCWKPVK